MQIADYIDADLSRFRKHLKIFSPFAVISAIQQFMLIRLGAFKTAPEKSLQKTRS